MIWNKKSCRHNYGELEGYGVGLGGHNHGRRLKREEVRKDRTNGGKSSRRIENNGISQSQSLPYK